MEAPVSTEMPEWAKEILKEIKNTENNLKETKNQMTKLKSNFNTFPIISAIWGLMLL